MFLNTFIQSLSRYPLSFSLSSLAILPVAFVLYWIVWIIYARNFHPLSKVPGPFLASISRLWVVQQLLRGDMEYTQRALHRKYGPLIRIAPNEVACASPDAIKRIYPVQGPLTKTDFYPVWGNTTFTHYPDHFSSLDEKVHSERRRIVNHVYSLSNVLQSESYIDKCSQIFVQRLGEYADAGEKLDLGEWLQMYAFDVIGELYFGRMFGFMEDRHDYGSYIKSLDTLMPPLCVAAVAPSYSRPFILGSSILVPAMRNAMKAIDNIAAAARSCVAERQQKLATSTEQPRRDLLQQLLDISREKGEKVDFGIHEIELEAYTALFAGSDTTAIAMRSVLYHLIRNPELYRQAALEVDTAAAMGKISSPIQYSEAIKLPFICACIKEGMRLHPSVGLTMPRLVPAGGMEFNGTYIPEGYRIGMNGAVVHYNQSIFGKDADEFRPSRWLEGDTTNMDKHMIQFGAGTRTCIGKNISLSELHKLIPQIIRHFEFELDNPKAFRSNNLWFNKQSGLIVKIRRRQPTQVTMV